jgi:hypothetical protein
MNMITPGESAASRSGPRFRLARGMDVLDSWSQTATQAARNSVYRVLFAVLDGSVFRRYSTVDSYARSQEFFVYLHDDLVIGIVLDDGSFTIGYIGPAGSQSAAA